MRSRFLRRKVDQNLALCVYTALLALALGSIFYWRVFPDCYVEGVGQTPFERLGLVISCSAYLAAVGLLIGNRREFDNRVFQFLAATLIVFFVEDLASAVATDIDGFAKTLAHLCQVVALYFVYKAFVEVGLKKPYDLLFRRQQQSAEEKLEMERRLLHAQKLESLGVLAGGIAHDFNNILAGIMGYADLALAELPASEPARENVEVIKTAAQRAADLTGQMLAYSGKGKFVVEPLSLSRMVVDSEKMLAMSVSKKATVTYDLAANLPMIEADAAQISQVIMNLVINASEALGEHGGAIAVSTSAVRCKAGEFSRSQSGADWQPVTFPAGWQPAPLPEGLYVCLEVKDTGCGMDGQTLAKIFDPFYTTKFAGRGLGLAAVHGIVRGHEGAIHVSSQPGMGTTFQVLFPASALAVSAVSAVPAVSTVPSEAEATVGQGSGTVLVVDDDELVRKLAGRMIARCGFSALLASGGREAIRLFREHQQEVTCVVLDLAMPDLDGGETFRELRRICPDVRVILCSGYSEEAATEPFAGQGLAGFLQKPYKLSTLIARIQEALPARS